MKSIAHISSQCVEPWVWHARKEAAALTCQRAQRSQSTAKPQILPALKGSCLPARVFKMLGSSFQSAQRTAQPGRRINNTSSSQPQVPQLPGRLQRAPGTAAQAAWSQTFISPSSKGWRCKKFASHSKTTWVLLFLLFSGSELMELRSLIFFFFFFFLFKVLRLRDPTPMSLSYNVTWKAPTGIPTTQDRDIFSTRSFLMDVGEDSGQWASECWDLCRFRYRRTHRESKDKCLDLVTAWDRCSNWAPNQEVEIDGRWCTVDFPSLFSLGSHPMGCWHLRPSWVFLTQNFPRHDLKAMSRSVSPRGFQSLIKLTSAQEQKGLCVDRGPLPAVFLDYSPFEWIVGLFHNSQRKQVHSRSNFHLCKKKKKTTAW